MNRITRIKQMLVSAEKQVFQVGFKKKHIKMERTRILKIQRLSAKRPNTWNSITMEKCLSTQK